MTRLADLLESAVGHVEPTFDVDDVVQRAARRRRSRRRRTVGALSATVAIVTVAAIAAQGGGSEHRVQVVTTTPTSSPAPVTPADVLVLDETGGVVAVDLTRRIATRNPIDGWRPGDQPFVSRLVGGDIVVGWGDVHATPIVGGPSRLLGTGVFVTATEPGAIWLTSYGKVQIPTERLVDMQGRALEEAPVPSGVALVGVPGGLALQTSTGIDIWDARTGRITRHLGTTVGTAAPAHGSLLAWCDQCVDSFDLTDLTTGLTRRIPLEFADGSGVTNAEFSSDGSKLAIAVASPTSTASSPITAVAVIDVATATIVSRFETGRRYASFAWSSDGQRLYAAASDTGDAGELFVHDLRTDETRDLGPEPAGSGRITAVVTRADADGLLTGTTPGQAGACPAPIVSSDNTTRRCSYHY
jgi:hypothetical protein